MERSAEINNYLASLYSAYETGFTLKPIYILCTVIGCYISHQTLPKIDFKKITSQDFLPLFPPPKEKQKKSHGHGFCNDVTTTTTTTTIKQYDHKHNN